MTVTLCLSCTIGLLNRRPRGSLCWMLAFFIASYQHLLWTSANQVPRPLRPDVAPSTTSCLQPSGTLLATALARRTQLNYIIVRRPLDLWNRMFNRHQVEITVMQFTGHSLPVHHSVVYHGIFFLARPISSANFRSSDFLSWLPLECVTFFRCITLNGIFGRVKRSKHNIPRFLVFWPISIMQ